jgi:Fuc2NAc and GlcNAc transferase
MIVLFGLSIGLTGAYRQYALTRRILDTPNQRSAHDTPIPRGGGVVFVGLFLGVIAWNVPHQLLLFGWVLAIAVLGYMDDKRPIAVHYRFIVHIILGIGALIALGGLPDISVLGWTCHFNAWTSGIGVIFLIWMLNLYNFMDGINGLAGFEAICTTLGMAMIYHLLQVPNEIQFLVVLAVVVAGFLIWNFPAAKLFMGDTGSGFLGFVFGIWTLQAAHIQPQLFWCWLIMLGVFIVDASVTILRRIQRKEPLYIAHSSHAYQHAARRFGKHWRVTLGVVLLNGVWLWPLALLVSLGYLSGLLGLVIAYLPLIILAYYFKAGFPSA